MTKIPSPGGAGNRTDEKGYDFVKDERYADNAQNQGGRGLKPSTTNVALPSCITAGFSMDAARPEDS